MNLLSFWCLSWKWWSKNFFIIKTITANHNWLIYKIDNLILFTFCYCLSLPITSCGGPIRRYWPPASAVSADAFILILRISKHEVILHGQSAYSLETGCADLIQGNEYFSVNSLFNIVCCFKDSGLLNNFHVSFSGPSVHCKCKFSNIRKTWGTCQSTCRVWVPPMCCYEINK